MLFLREEVDCWLIPEKMVLLLEDVEYRLIVVEDERSFDSINTSLSHCHIKCHCVKCYCVKCHCVQVLCQVLLY